MEIICSFLKLAMAITCLCWWPIPVMAEKQWRKHEDTSSFSYKNSGCNGAWETSKLVRWLRTKSSWLPASSGPPFYSSRSSKIYKNEIEFLKNHTEDAALFSSRDTTENRIMRQDQLIWVDLDGDKICDLIGWDFEYDSEGVTGHVGVTRYFFFLQKKSGFKLIDYSVEPCGDRGYCEGQVPDAFQPIWMKGESRPFIVARSNVRLISDETMFAATRFDPEKYIQGLLFIQWDSHSNRWVSSGEDPKKDRLVRPIWEFVRDNPIPPTVCQDVPVDCVTN